MIYYAVTCSDLTNVNNDLLDLTDSGNVQSFSVGEDESPYITYKAGADTVTKKLGDGFREIALVKANNGMVMLNINFEDSIIQTLADSNRSQSGKYIKTKGNNANYPNEVYTATALVDGTFNVIDKTGTFSKITVSAGSVIASNTTLLVVWI